MTYLAFEEWITGMTDFMYNRWYYDDATTKQRRIADSFREVGIDEDKIDRDDIPDLPRREPIIHRKVKYVTTKRDILISSRFVFQQQAFTPREYAQKTSTNYNTARRELATAQKKGIVERTNKGEYRYR